MNKKSNSDNFRQDHMLKIIKVSLIGGIDRAWEKPCMTRVSLMLRALIPAIFVLVCGFKAAAQITPRPQNFTQNAAFWLRFTLSGIPENEANQYIANLKAADQFDPWKNEPPTMAKFEKLQNAYAEYLSSLKIAKLEAQNRGQALASSTPDSFLFGTAPKQNSYTSLQIEGFVEKYTARIHLIQSVLAFHIVHGDRNFVTELRNFLTNKAQNTFKAEDIWPPFYSLDDLEILGINPFKTSCDILSRI